MQTNVDKKDKNTKLFLHLKKWLEKAVLDYSMIEEGDRVLIGVSGGADSYGAPGFARFKDDFCAAIFLLSPSISTWVLIQDFIAYRELGKIFSGTSIPVCDGKDGHRVLIAFGFQQEKPLFFVFATAAKKNF